MSDMSSYFVDYHDTSDLLKEELWERVSIGAKRCGTWDQSSQKLFELADIFRNIINVILN